MTCFMRFISFVFLRLFNIPIFAGAAIATLFWIGSQHYSIAYNYTLSIPFKVMLVDLARKEGKRGEYLVYKKPLLSSIPYVKKIGGIEGDFVWKGGTRMYVRGKPLGDIKTVSLEGRILEPGPCGKIPRGYYYVTGAHRDSYDSRYAKMGWVHEKEVVGIAIPLL